MSRPIRRSRALASSGALIVLLATLPSAAQELPAGVAAELVEGALEQDFEERRGSPALEHGVLPLALSALSVTIGLVTLLVGWRRVHDPVAVSVAGPAGAGGEGVGGSGGAAGDPEDDEEARRAAWRAARARAAADPSARPGSGTLVLPPHVAAILQRAVADPPRPSGAGPTESTSDDDDGDDSEGFDHVVPGFDPWNGDG